MNQSSPAPTTRDYIDLLHGKFDWTTPAQLEDAFAAFKASKTNHLAVFFHGGLVNRSEGLGQAQRLIDGYRKAGAYPFFFIWNSGLLTALEAALLPFADNLVIRRVVERHLVFFTRLLDDTLKLKTHEGDVLRAIGNLPRDTPPRRLTLLGALGRVVDSIWLPRRHDVALPDPDLWRQKIDAFEKDLETDVAGLGDLSDGLKFTADIGSKILRRLWERFRSGHDHGLYTSLIEEVGVAIGLDAALGKLWGTMKTDIDQAFLPDPAVYGGTAFLQGLTEVSDANTRLTLIGHSGGSVYIDRMLRAIDAKKLPIDIKADVVFIAAALSFDELAATISSGVFARRVRNYRLFALKNECEAGYWQVPGVYDKSLLYLLSALCEFDPDEDKPLVGMQRYWSEASPYTVPNILTVTGTIPPAARVWSRTDPLAPPGFRASAVKHEGFAEEPKTNESVGEFLR
ncbi:MAG TPA: hypothetical protein VKG21_04600 [Casimicrobiaceae bacterium]|nr:hypothetical protein [Casimicrobiaceae bacterium]